MYVKFGKPAFIETLRTKEDNASPLVYFQEFLPSWTELFDLKDIFFILSPLNNFIKVMQHQKKANSPQIF